MTAPVVALLVVAYFAIGAVVAGLADRHLDREDRNGPIIAATWPAYLATLAIVAVVYVAHIPFRAIYRRIGGKP